MHVYVCVCLCECYPSVSCEVPNARLLFDWQSEGRINCLSGNAIALTITLEKTRVRHRERTGNWEPIWLSLIAENVKVNWGTQQFTIPALVQKPLKAHERRQKDFDQNCPSNLTFTSAAYYFFCFSYLFFGFRIAHKVIRQQHCCTTTTKAIEIALKLKLKLNAIKVCIESCNASNVFGAFCALWWF